MPLSSCLLITVPDSPLRYHGRVKNNKNNKGSNMAQPVRNVSFSFEERKRHLEVGERVAESKEAEATVREEGARQGLGGAPGAATFNLCLTTAHDEACFYTHRTHRTCARVHTHTLIYRHI